MSDTKRKHMSGQRVHLRKMPMRPGGVAATEEFADRPDPPIVMGTLLIAVYPTQRGREYVLDCKHATTSYHRDIDPGDDQTDAEQVGALVNQHHESYNEQALMQDAAELCGCEPPRRLT